MQPSIPEQTVEPKPTLLRVSIRSISHKFSFATFEYQCHRAGGRLPTRAILGAEEEAELYRALNTPGTIRGFYYLAVSMDRADQPWVNRYTKQSVEGVNPASYNLKNATDIVLTVSKAEFHSTTMQESFGTGICLLPEGHSLNLRGLCHETSIGANFDKIDREFYVYGVRNGMPHFR